MKFLPFLVAIEGHACSVGPPHLENPSQTLLEVELAPAVLLAGVSWTLLWCADYKCIGKMDIKLSFVTRHGSCPSCSQKQHRVFGRT